MPTWPRGGATGTSPFLGGAVEERPAPCRRLGFSGLRPSAVNGAKAEALPVGVAPASGWSWAFSVPQRPSKGPEPRSSRASRVDGNVPSLSSGTARPPGPESRACRGSRDVGERAANEVKKRGGGGRQQGGRGEMPRGMRTGIPGSPTSCSADSRAPRAVEGQPQRKGRNVTSGQQPAVTQAVTLAAQPGSPLEANSSPHTEGRDALPAPRPPRVCFPGGRFRSASSCSRRVCASPASVQNPRPQSGAVHTGVAGRAQESSDRTSATLSSGSPPTRG